MSFELHDNQLADFIKDGLEYPALEQGEVIILGLKGLTKVTNNSFKTNDNEPDLYNDLVIPFCYGPDYYIKMLPRQATVEPGYYYTKIEVAPGGAAHFPLYRTAIYKTGFHKGKRALVPKEAQVVVRDENGNFRIDSFERHYKGWFGIHIHKGGHGPSIGKNSAGCIAIISGEWVDFLAFCERNSKSGTFKVLVLEGNDLQVWQTDPYGFHPTMHIGSLGPHVEKLQLALNKTFKANLKPDGDFGLYTRQKFLEAQKALKLDQTGICDKTFWRSL